MDSRLLKNGRTKEEIMAYRNAFDALKEILIAEFQKKPAVRDYAPGWEHKQIAVNEWNSAIESVLKLLEVSDK
jgi:hypothetical protein